LLGVGDIETTKNTPQDGAVKASKGSDGPPHTPLDFNVPDEVFRAARLAEAGTPESFWSYALYRGPQKDGLESRKVTVHYCKSKHTTERVCRKYFMNEKILGLDLEWAPDASKFQSVRRNVSLIQIASPSRIALFHVALYPKTENEKDREADGLVAPSLKRILENPGITKAGVFIRGDCSRLRHHLGIQTRGSFELSHLYKLVKYSSSGQVQHVNKKLVSMATQVQEYLGLPMFKGQDVRSSDWSQPLRMDQIICKSCLAAERPCALTEIRFSI
jgi:hypothetical protein